MKANRSISCFMCRLLAKAYEMARARGEKCAICAFVITILSIPVCACAADRERREGPCSNTVPAETTEVKVMPFPSTMVLRFIGVSGPQTIVMRAMNANETYQSGRNGKDNPYAPERKHQHYSFSW